MKFMLLVYNDSEMLDAIPQPRADAMMRDCFSHTDVLQQDGKLIESQQLDEPRTARSVRIRQGKLMTTDGPYSEAKEVLGGFNLIDAENMEEAVRIASHFPWASTGCIEVRPVRDLDEVRRRVSEAEGAAT